MPTEILSANPITASTQRLVLRQWQDADLPAFAEINSDPEVMKYFPRVLSDQESNDLANRCRDRINQNGWGFWAVERKVDGRFLGFVGLNEPHYRLPVSPCIEIGWRLGRESWGHGYASEAARKCLEIAFCKLGLEEVYAFTPPSNSRSRAVMERIGMNNTFENFEHPLIPERHILREHVLYKVVKDNWKSVTNPS